VTQRSAWTRADSHQFSLSRRRLCNPLGRSLGCGADCCAISVALPVQHSLLPSIYGTSGLCRGRDGASCGIRKRWGDEADTRRRFEQWARNPESKANATSAILGVSMVNVAIREGLKPSSPHLSSSAAGGSNGSFCVRTRRFCALNSRPASFRPRPEIRGSADAWADLPTGDP
jgi:hypothetical protein